MLVATISTQSSAVAAQSNQQSMALISQSLLVAAQSTAASMALVSVQASLMMGITGMNENS